MHIEWIFPISILILWAERFRKYIIILNYTNIYYVWNIYLYKYYIKKEVIKLQWIKKKNKKKIGVLSASSDLWGVRITIYLNGFTLK
jgi:hypothetical protein